MNYVEVELHHRKLRVYASGIVHVKRKHNDEYYLKAVKKHSGGYRQLTLYYQKVRKYYYVHRIVGYAYHGLDIDDPEDEIDHINRIRHDNRVENLRPSTRQQNQWNNNAKGYTWDDHAQTWKVQIQLNGKTIYLGRFKKQDEQLASDCYQQAKLKYHIIE